MRLSDASVLSLAGRDAAAFAQSQFTGDVAALADLQWQWSAWLSAKGRVIALFQLLRIDAERYWAILPDFPADELAERLRRFVFRSKVTLATDAVIVVGMRDHAAVQGNVAMRDPDGRIVLARSSHPARAIRIEAPDGAPPSNEAFDAAWRLQDIAEGLPRLAGTAVEAYTPQMLGLDRLHAYSLRKGCYPGQEIVARTHFLGQAKRGLQRVSLSHAAAVGDRLQGDGGGSAELVCSAGSGATHEALIVATLEPPVTLWRDADGHTAHPLPLDDTLIR